VCSVAAPCVANIVECRCDIYIIISGWVANAFGLPMLLPGLPMLLPGLPMLLPGLPMLLPALVAMPACQPPQGNMRDFGQPRRCLSGGTCPGQRGQWC